MATTEIEEDFLSALAQEGFLGLKVRGPHPIISVSMHPWASAEGSILEKSGYVHLGEDSWTSQE